MFPSCNKPTFGTFDICDNILHFSDSLPGQNSLKRSTSSFLLFLLNVLDINRRRGLEIITLRFGLQRMNTWNLTTSRKYINLSQITKWPTSRKLKPLSSAMSLTLLWEKLRNPTLIIGSPHYLSLLCTSWNRIFCTVQLVSKQYSNRKL